MDQSDANASNTYQSVRVTGHAAPILGNNYGNIVHNLVQSQFVLDDVPLNLVTEICNAIRPQLQHMARQILDVGFYAGKRRHGDDSSDDDGFENIVGVKRRRKQLGYQNHAQMAVGQAQWSSPRKSQTRMSIQAQSVLRCRQRRTPVMPGMLDPLPYMRILNRLRRGVDAYMTCLFLYAEGLAFSN